MSENTPCNLCIFKSMKKSYERFGRKLVAIETPDGGTQIYKVPRNQKIDISENSKQKSVWFMKLPNECRC